MPDAKQEVISARILLKEGERNGSLSVVVNGSHLLFVIKRKQILQLAESVFEAIRKSEE